MAARSPSSTTVKAGRTSTKESKVQPIKRQIRVRLHFEKDGAIIFKGRYRIQGDVQVMSSVKSKI